MKTNTAIWIVLILLSATSYGLRGGSAAGIILSAAGVKAALVGWQFMELRTAHLVWRLALFLLLFVILTLVAILAPPSAQVGGA